MMNRIPLLALLVGCFVLGQACKPAADTKPVDFAKQIGPLLESRCVNCHHSGALFGELNLENHAHATKPRAAGPVLVSGKPDESRLYLVLTLPEGDRKAMPPTGHRISVEEVALLKRWISEGAKWPEGADGVVKPTVNVKPPGV